MARPRNQEARRQELVRVASRLLVEHGAAGARLTDIAEAAGVTPAAVTYYYPSLIELYGETYATATQEYIVKRRQLVEQADGPIARLVACLRLGVPEAGTSSYAATVLLEELSALESREPDISRSGAVFEREQLELFTELIEDGIAAGLFRPVLSVADTARAILSLEDGLASPVVGDRLEAAESMRVLLVTTGALIGADLLGRPSGP